MKNEKARPTREERRLRKELKALTDVVSAFLRALDAEMLTPSDRERGHRIARISNTLDMANDSARHFGLGVKLTRFTEAP